MPSLTLDLKVGGPLHQRIIREVEDRIRQSQSKWFGRHTKWQEAEDRALAFLPERDIDALRRTKREEGKPQYTTIQVPYSYAVLMASHTYWTTVFMARAPVLQYTGRHGEGQQQVQAVEALIDYQMQVGEMLVPLYIWLADVGKYGAGIIGNFWDEEEVTVSEIIERPKMIFDIVPTGKTERVRTSRRVPGYQGNRLFNVRPYDFFPDPRVTLANFQKGEFCGQYVEISRNSALEREAQGFYTNIKEALSGGPVGARQGGSTQLELPDEDVETIGDGAGRRKIHSHIIKAYHCFINLIPKDWGLGQSTLPEKWAFTVTADYKTVIEARPLGAIHNKFPFAVMELEPEGYAISNRGIPEILEPVQNTVDWLINSHFYAVRKTLNNMFLVDPSKVVMKDLLEPQQGLMVRLKPGSYGEDPRSALHQLQMTDITRTHMQDLAVMLELGQRVSGVNDQMLGMISQGGRRTAAEVRTSSTFGINRLKTTSEYFSVMGWQPLSMMLVQNSQQYYEAVRKFKIVGDLAQEAGPQFIEVSPENLQGFYDYVPVDGTLPVDRFAQANLWRELLGQLRNFPVIMQQYDIGRIFAWVAQLAGLKNINQFKIQVVPDGQAQLAAQQGNVVPLGGQQAAGPQDLNRVPEPGQVSQLGTTG